PSATTNGCWPSKLRPCTASSTSCAICALSRHGFMCVRRFRSTPVRAGSSSTSSPTGGDRPRREVNFPAQGRPPAVAGHRLLPPSGQRHRSAAAPRRCGGWSVCRRSSVGLLHHIGMAVGVGAHLQAHGGQLLVAEALVCVIASRAGVVDLGGTDDLAEEVAEPADSALGVRLSARLVLGAVGGRLRGGGHQWNLSNWHRLCGRTDKVTMYKQCTLIIRARMSCRRRSRSCAIASTGPVTKRDG